MGTEASAGARDNRAEFSRRATAYSFMHALPKIVLVELLATDRQV